MLAPSHLPRNLVLGELRDAVGGIVDLDSDARGLNLVIPGSPDTRDMGQNGLRKLICRIPAEVVGSGVVVGWFRCIVRAVCICGKK